MDDDRDPSAGPPGRRATSRPAPSAPSEYSYMTVGSGTTSAAATALMASLDRDSGYGGSIASGDAYKNDGAAPAWHPDLLMDYDMPTPPLSQPLFPGSAEADHERRILASHIHQQLYNRNRVALARAINRTVEVLRGLQQMNTDWPAHYPSPAEKPSSRPGLAHTQSTMGPRRDASSPAPRPVVRRAATSLADDNPAESSSSGAQRTEDEDAAETLITPQAAHDFSVLTLDLKLQGLTASEIAHSMDRRAVAALLDGRIGRSVRHLQRLRDRIEDTASKVLVTGDLNAGKSTFCNALLRRKVLPEDQQPCTSIFCEVLDARENGGVEEAHAVHQNAVYDRLDERTYDVYPLKRLEELVTDNERYAQCKVYVRDARPVDQSLLNNGVVDIALIDAPGLNADSLQTTAVFARQEEIDVVVFVVSAANHFTLSAKEFIWNAAHEKAYIFIVVNGYDQIRDQRRCERMILEQVATLSPRTFKESSELVHFVSSNAVPVGAAIPAGGPGGGGGGGGSSGGSGVPDDAAPPDDDDDPGPTKHGQSDSPLDKGKGKQKEQLADFEHLEGSLRRFVLEKRARSKLAPAKTYLTNVLGDLYRLAELNRDIAQGELDRATAELKELEPACERSQKARNEVSDEVERNIETACNDIYQRTKTRLDSAIAKVAEQDLGVEYPGLWDAFQYAEDVKTAILDQIASAVLHCEDDARARAVAGVGEIKGLAMRHLGDEYQELTFRSDLMFRRKKDALARQVEAPIELWDFVDVRGLWERQEKVAGTGMAVTVVGVLGGRMIGGVGWLDGVLGAVRIMGTRNLRHLIVPGILTAACIGAAYVLHAIPRSLPPRLARRLAATLAELDYTHLNGARVAGAVGRVLRYPADGLRLGLQRSVEQLVQQRDATGKVRRESAVARKYFGNLVRESGEVRRTVESVDLEGTVGVAGAYESGIMV